MVLQDKRQKKPPKKKPKLKTLQLQAEATELGKTLGLFKAEQKIKKSQKGWEKSLRDHAGKAIDRLDPLETVAVGSLTYIIWTTSIDDAIAQLLGIPAETIENKIFTLGLSYVCAFVIIRHFEGLAMADTTKTLLFILGLLGLTQVPKLIEIAQKPLIPSIPEHIKFMKIFPFGLQPPSFWSKP